MKFKKGDKVVALISPPYRSLCLFGTVKNVMQGSEPLYFIEVGSGIASIWCYSDQVRLQSDLTELERAVYETNSF